MFYLDFSCLDYYQVGLAYDGTAPYTRGRGFSIGTRQFGGESEGRRNGSGRSRLSSSNRLLVWISLCSPRTYPMFCGFQWGFIVKLPHISRGFGYFICVCWFAVWFFYFNWRFGLWYRRRVTPRAGRVSLFFKAWRKLISFLSSISWSQSILKQLISLLFSRRLLGFIWTPFD